MGRFLGNKVPRTRFMSGRIKSQGKTQGQNPATFLLPRHTGMGGGRGMANNRHSIGERMGNWQKHRTVTIGRLFLACSTRTKHVSSPNEPR